MATLQHLQHGLDRAWQQLNEGWIQLRRRASRAITRFYPREDAHGLQTAGEQSPHAAPAWGLLAAEVREADDEILVRLEAPGMEKDGFDIQVIDDLLVVRGEKRSETNRSSGAYHIMECAYGAFERAIPLPGPVDESRTQARYHRGVLEVTLPKNASARKRRIAVHSA